METVIMGKVVVAAQIENLTDLLNVASGQLPLEGLDFVVDPIGQRLIGNPAHGGEYVIDLF